MALKSVGDPDNVETSSARTPMMTGVEKPSGDPGVRAPFKGEWVALPEPSETDADTPRRRERPAAIRTYEPISDDELDTVLHHLSKVLARTRMTEAERNTANGALAFLSSFVS